MPYIMHRFAGAPTGYGRTWLQLPRVADRAGPPHPLADDLRPVSCASQCQTTMISRSWTCEKNTIDPARGGLCPRRYDMDEDLTPSEAHWYAYNGPADMPSSYALAGSCT